ncbi:MAG: hypothetical protein ACT4N2_06775 [Hyphomicrobium sp.]
MTMAFAGAMLAIAGFAGIRIADANQCAAQCYAAEQACMQQTKGSASCSAQLTRCLQSCRAGR